MSAHTPGPWTSRESNTYTRDRFVIRPVHPLKGSTLGFAPLCAVEGDARIVDAATRQANARLIAAAPELYDFALRVEARISALAYAGIDLDNAMQCMLAEARAAIAKAMQP